jgi:hypothetical protein
MPETWAYELEPEKLMERLWKATARTAISGSGLVIDLSGYSSNAEALYLHGVALSRLKGETPPFRPGEKVHIDPQNTYYCGSANNSGRGYHRISGEAKPGVTYKIDRIWYEEVGYAEKRHLGWTLSFESTVDGNFPGYRFEASRFVKIEQTEPVAA